MSHAFPEPDGYVSREEYRRWYDAQPRGRFERIDGRIAAMATERGAHIRMKAAVYEALKRAIAAAGVDCQALPDGATVESGDSDYEPDALVNCGEPMGDEAIAAPSPVVVVEVLSPGTASTDTGGKLEGYFRVPGIVHYLIIHPIRRSVIHHRRDGGRIETQVRVNGTISLDPPGIALTVEDLYG